MTALGINTSRQLFSNYGPVKIFSCFNTYKNNVEKIFENFIRVGPKITNQI